MQPRNLFDLFLRGLGELEGSAQALERAERTLNSAFDAHDGLARFATNLIAINRSRHPQLRRAWEAAGLGVIPQADPLCETALTALGEIPCRPVPIAVAATCAVEAFRGVVACFEQRIGTLAETALLVGCDRLHDALADWGFSWGVFSTLLRNESLRFRAMAYVADIEVWTGDPRRAPLALIAGRTED